MNYRQYRIAGWKWVASGFLIGCVLPVLAQRKLTLQEAVLGQYRDFYPQRTRGVNWIPETHAYSYLSEDYQTLKRTPAKKDKPVDIVTADMLKEMTGEAFRYAKLIEWKDETHFYTSSNGKYFLVNVADKTAQPLGELPKESENEVLHAGTGHVAYTIDHDLYVQSADNRQQRITNNAPHIVSGQAIARSEFGISGGIFWSHSGDQLAFYQKDESNVADYPLLDITTPTGSLNAIKYPMAGQPSEKSAVGVHHLSSEKTVYIRPRGAPDDYLTNLAWGPRDQFVYLVEVNRDQNHTQLQQYDAQTGQWVKTLIEERNDKWTEPEHPVYFIDDHRFVWLSERDGFMNLYLYSDEGKLIRQLTANQWVVKKIIGHTSTHLYFEGTGPSAKETNCFSVEMNSGEQTAVTQGGGTHAVKFSSDFKYLFDAMSSTEIPRREWIGNGLGKEVREVLRAENPYRDIQMGKAHYGTIKAGDDTTALHYRLIQPADFDTTKQYPVLVYVYGGPHAQMVRDRWLGGASLWMYWMAQQGYLVFTVDGRGSANRGFAFESVIHRQLGTAEMEDQLRGVDFLKQLPYVDTNRLAVHGWSFGGFMTASLMLRQAGTFNVGVAGGPVTDWAYYEVMYGERYMDRPEQNEEGYAKSRLMNHVAALEGKLLLIHGTVDDVVVMQHSLALVKAFVEEGVQVDFFPYPMHPHNVKGLDRVHLMQNVLSYVMEHNHR